MSHEDRTTPSETPQGLYSEYDGALEGVDVLRQMNLFDAALERLRGVHSPRSASLRVRVLRSAGRNEGALRLLEEAGDGHDDDVEMHANRIAVLDRLHRDDEVDALLNSPHHAELVGSNDRLVYRILVARARALGSQGHLVQAAEELDRIPVRTATVDGWRITAYLRLGRAREAHRLALELAEASGPDDWRRKAVAGRALFRLGNTDQAIRALEAAVARQPSYPHAWRWLATTLRSIGDFDDAEQVIQRASRVLVPVPAGPDEPTVMLRLGDHPILLVERALLHLARFDGSNHGELELAAAFADEAWDRCPDCGEALWAKARILRVSGGREAIAELRRLARQKARGWVNTRIELGHALADATQFDAAVAAYDDVLHDNPRNREALLGRLTVLANQTSPTGTPVHRLTDTVAARSAHADELAATVAQFQERLTEDVVMISIAAERLAQAGHYDHADALFRTVRLGSANPNHGLSHSGAIRAWAWARDFRRAQQVIDAAVDASGGPDETPLVVGLAEGMLRGDQGRFADANARFERLREQLGRSRYPSREDLASVALWLSTSFRWLLMHDKARQVAEEALDPGYGQRAHFTRAADLHDELGWNFFECREFTRAKASFQRALNIDPRHPAAMRGLVQVHRAIGNFADATAIAERALVINPLDTNMMCELAWLHGEAGHLRQALRYLEQVLDREVANAHALEWKIIYLLRDGRLADAWQAAERALDLRPESPGIVDAACAVQLRLGEGERARDLALRAWRDDDHRFAMMAAAVCEQADPENPEWPAWTARLTNLSANPEVVRVRASLLRRHWHHDEAESLVRMHLDQVSWPGLHGELAEILLDLGRSDEAEAGLMRMHAMVPWSRSVVRRIATIRATHNDIDGALDITRQTIDRAIVAGELIPVELLVIRGEVLLHAGRFSEAIDVAVKATRHETRHIVEARVLEIDARGAAGEVDRALELATDLNAERPGSRRARLMLARCLEFADRSREADHLLEGCDKALPHHSPTLVIASWIKRGLGEVDQARTLVERWLKASPRDPGLRAELGWILLQQRDVAQAWEEFTALAERPDRHVRAVGLSGQGWCHLRGQQPDIDKALDAFAAAVDADPQLPEAHLGASVAYRMRANAAKDEDQRNQHLARSLTNARKLIDLDSTAASCRMVGRAAYELREMAAAHHYLQQSLSLNPHRGDWAGMGLLLLRQAQTDQALGVLSEGMTYHPDDVDLMATLGAVYLDRALRFGEKGKDAHQALHYLRAACSRRSDGPDGPGEPPHLFAVHNLATALAWLDDRASAEQLLESAVQDAKNQPVLDVDVDDLPLLKLHLVELLQQPHRSRNPRRYARAQLLLRQARREGRRRLLDEFRRIDEFRKARRSSDAAASSRRGEGRWQGRFGLVITVITLVAFVALWVDESRRLGIGLVDLPISQKYLMTCVLLGAAFAGLIVQRMTRLRLGRVVEITSVASQFVTRDVDLPEHTPSLGFGRLDVIRTQWVTPWSAGTRLPRLGPAVGTLINTYYAHRDAFLPWRRL